MELISERVLLSGGAALLGVVCGCRGRTGAVLGVVRAGRGLDGLAVVDETVVGITSVVVMSSVVVSGVLDGSNIIVSVVMYRSSSSSSRSPVVTVVSPGAVDESMNTTGTSVSRGATVAFDVSCSRSLSASNLISIPDSRSLSGSFVVLISSSSSSCLLSLSSTSCPKPLSRSTSGGGGLLGSAAGEAEGAGPVACVVESGRGSSVVTATPAAVGRTFISGTESVEKELRKHGERKEINTHSHFRPC